ncbi:MAG: tetratricopeptide repeat protein [Balneolaceae bacterium]|nr:tetratricopeptide repeat protein [Balneolaceae bacterium]
MVKTIIIYIFLSLLCITNGVSQVQSREELSGKAAYIQGMEAFSSEQYEEARSHLLQAYKDLDQPAGVSYSLADTFLQLDDLPNAILYGKEAVAADPTNKWYRMKLAQIYRNAGQNQATLAELSTLLKQYPDDFDVLFMLAKTYREYGEFVKSNQTLDKILKLTGPTIQANLLKFRNYEELGVTDSALVQLETIRSIDPDNLEVLNLLGNYYSKSGKEDKAKTVLGDALNRNARDPQSLINLAGLYFEEQKWDSAGTLLGNFMADSLNEAEAKMVIAQYLYNKVQDNPQNIQLKIETERIFDLFTESETDYGPAFTLTGQFFAQQGKTDQALEKLKTANKLLPEDDIAWRQRLQLLISENKLEQTIETGLVANQHIPDDAFIQFFIGSAYMLKGNNTEAEKWLQKASRAPARRPFKSTVYSTLGDVQANLNKAEASDKAYETALRYDPDNHNAMNNYAYNLSIRGEKLDKAKELALEAIEQAPENPAYLDTVGWIYYKLGDYDRARRFIKASIDIGDAGAVVLEHLGDVYKKLGKPDEARKWWKAAFEKDTSKTHLKDKIQ